MSNILNVTENIQIDEAIIDYEWHSHNPYTSNSFKNSDEIRIPIHQQDVYTLPSRSYLLIEGKVKKSANGADDITTELVTNAAAFLFDEIRYELCGVEIDRIKNVGITSLIKNILTARPYDANWLANASWNLPSMGTLENAKPKFSFCIPLKMLLGFSEDYDKILLNVKQELVLLRSSTDKNAIFQPAAALHDSTIELEKITWRIPYIRIEDSIRLPLLRLVENDQPIAMAFRRWQLHVWPSVTQAQTLTWTVMTSSQNDKARYVVVAFQTDRKDNAAKNASHFDLCDLQKVKLYLNSKYYPYDDFNGNKTVMYDYFSRFQSSYYPGCGDQPCLDNKTFFAKTPIFVIDCSKQLDTIKTGSIDVRIELQTSKDIPANTTAYCFIICDALVQYKPLTGIVKKII